MNTATMPSVGDHRPVPTGWTGRRVTSFVAGSILVMTGLGIAGTGATLAVADRTTRDADGFLMSPEETLASDTFAITSGDLQVHSGGAPGWLPEGILGDVRLSAASATGSDLFLGVARTEDVATYLAGVRHDTLVDVRDGEPLFERAAGGANVANPTEQTIWIDSATGTRPDLTWEVTDGDWTVVLMSADGSAPVEADVRAGAEVPVLDTAIAVLLVTAGLLLAIGAVLIVLPVRAAGRADRAG